MMSAMSNRNCECKVSINKYEYLYDNQSFHFSSSWVRTLHGLHGNISTTGK